MILVTISPLLSSVGVAACLSLGQQQSRAGGGRRAASPARVFIGFQCSGSHMQSNLLNGVVEFLLPLC